jgi:hypothetical protein
LRGRTPAQAVQRFVQDRQVAVSCVTDQIVRASGFDPNTGPHALVLARGEAVRVASPDGLALRVTENYELVQDTSTRDRWRIAVTGYWYAVERLPAEEELLAFHWHPRVEDVNFPHLHLGHTLVADVGFSRVHVPTGQVTLRDVLRLLVRDLHVRPRRPNWRDVLQ